MSIDRAQLLRSRIALVARGGTVHLLATDPQTDQSLLVCEGSITTENIIATAGKIHPHGGECCEHCFGRLADTQRIETMYRHVLNRTHAEAVA